jgi:hypothetical protein
MTSRSSLQALGVVAALLVGACGLGLTGLAPLDEAGGDASAPEASDSRDAGSTPPADAAAVDADSSADGGDGGVVRVTAGLVLLYTFDEGSGSMVLDHAGVAPAVPLTIATPDAATWLPSALGIPTTNILLSAGNEPRMATACIATGAFSAEVWVEPAATGGAYDRIFALSPTATDRDFTLSQNASEYAIAIRTSTQNPKTIQTTDASVTTSLSHVVAERDATGAVSVYVDGVLRGSGTATGDFSTWDTTFPVDIADAPTRDRPWRGALHLAALYCRALTPAEIAQNYAAGPDP